VLTSFGSITSEPNSMFHKILQITRQNYVSLPLEILILA